MDGLYELFIVQDPKLKLYQGVFNTFPDIKEWSMKDLYSRHPDPSKPFLYMYRCRKDDVIVLSNGEKIAPALIEATLMSHPLVKGAMIVGQGKFQPAALLDLLCEVPRDSTARYQLLESLRFTIAEANTHAPAHGKLDQYHILFANPSKPINYLGQGKIQRKSALRLYEKDFEELYKNADEAVEQLEFSNLPDLNPHSLESVALWLEQLIKEIMKSEHLQRDTDFFTAGLDSLQVIQMARELRFQARKLGVGDRSAGMFPPASIYTHPTTNRLAAHILQKLGLMPSSNGTSVQLKEHQSDESPSIGEMHRLFQRYSENLPSSALRPLPPSKNKIVLLTGSTGSLGSYLLNELQNDRDVSHIICLNRSADAAFRQAQLSIQRGLDTPDSDRVEFLQGDLSKPSFGLQTDTYTRLLQSVSHVIRQYSPRTISWPHTDRKQIINGQSTSIGTYPASSHLSEACDISLTFRMHPTCMLTSCLFPACPLLGHGICQALYLKPRSMTSVLRQRWDTASQNWFRSVFSTKRPRFLASDLRAAELGSSQVPSNSDWACGILTSTSLR